MAGRKSAYRKLYAIRYMPTVVGFEARWTTQWNRYLGSLADGNMNNRGDMA